MNHEPTNHEPPPLGLREKGEEKKGKTMAKVAPSHGGRVRLGMVVELKPECYEAYTDAHADAHVGVRDLLVK